MCACCESIASVDARGGVDRIAQFTQTIDVPADRPIGDFEPISEFRTAPEAVGLQQRQEQEGSPGRIVLHHGILAPIEDRFRPQ